MYKSNRRAVEKTIRRNLIGVAEYLGSTISHQIMTKQKKNIYNHTLPAKYKYTRTHELAKYTGYRVKTFSGIVLIFSTKVYAQYLERLVGKRWETHWKKIDLKMDIEKLKMPRKRPYANFVPGMIQGLKLAKRKYRSIKWKLT